MIKGDLLQIKCLQYTIKQLKEYEHLVNSTLSSKFESLALNFNFLSGGGGDESEIDSDAELATQMYPLAQALIHAGSIMEVFVSYKERIKTEVANIVKTVVSTELAGGGHPGGKVNVSNSHVSEQLKAMNSRDFLSLLECIFEHLILITHRISRVNSILLGCLGVESLPMSPTSARENMEEEEEDNGGGSSSASPMKGSKKEEDMEGLDGSDKKVKEKEKATTGTALSTASSTAPTAPADGKKDVKELSPAEIVAESNEILKFTCIRAQKHVIQLFDVRKDLHLRYSLEDLHRLYSISANYTNMTEKHVGKRVKLLLISFLAQAKANLELQHESRMRELLLELDGEDWKPKAFPSDTQDYLNAIMKVCYEHFLSLSLQIIFVHTCLPHYQCRTNSL